MIIIIVIILCEVIKINLISNAIYSFTWKTFIIFPVTSPRAHVTRHANGLRNRIESCRNWMGYVPGDFTASDFTCKRIYHTKISHARALHLMVFITPISYFYHSRRKFRAATKR